MALLAYAAHRQYFPGHGVHEHDPTFGELSLAAGSGAVTGLLAWDDPAALWDAFSTAGRLEPLAEDKRVETAAGKATNAALVTEVSVPAGEEVTIPILLTWHFPNYYFQDTRVGNRYTHFWPGAVDSAAELAREWPQLHARTERYRKSTYDSSLPYYVTDCITSQTSTIRSEVCVWLADGTFAGFEGADGCCPMNCSHVWGYEQSLARLFPELERSMREADLKHQQRADGGINNRIALPLRPAPTGEMPFADGHASGILKAYREHLNSTTDGFLREYWPNVKKAVEYLVKLDGTPPDGILEGDQWNTYDCVVYGPNSFIGSYYLAALRAGEEMALLMGEPDTAAGWRRIFQSGQKRLVELCWNGEYFVQNLPDYEKRATQWGPGCLSDQLIGQWWAHQLRLGYVLPQVMVRTALKAVFKHNWMWDLSSFQHRQRVFADQHDMGLLNCTWPRGGRPANPILYCDEVWTGVEYQVAGHMVYEGMLEEAFTIIRGARERYDGKRRNPWNEIECGGHYARAMANWSVLLGLSGYHYDGPRGHLAFDPIYKPERYRSLFTSAEGWGSFSQERRRGIQRNELRLDHGRLALRTLELGIARAPEKVTVRQGKRRLAVTHEGSGTALRLRFPEGFELAAGERLDVEIG
jgi:non-lysosomal glucosylceramidase